MYIGGLPPDVSGLTPAFQVKTANGQPSTLYDLTVHNYNSSPRMLILLDQAATPINYNAQALGPCPVSGPNVNGSVINSVMWAFPVAGLTNSIPGTLSLAYLIPPLRFRVGIWAVLSTVMTTPFTCTTTTTNDGFFVGVGQRS
jgi:hypothetical protein